MHNQLKDYLSTLGWPSWLESLVTFTILLLEMIAIVVVGWLIATFIGRALRHLGRRFTKADDLDGTVWDFVASAAKFVIIGFSILLAVDLYAGLGTLPWLANYGAPSVRAVIILALAWFIASKVADSIRGFGDRVKKGRHQDNTLFSFLSSVARYGLLALAVAIALQQFGSLGSITAIVGASAIAIGLALQDTLKAVAGGVMLAAFRPFRIGDWVEIDGYEGEVIDITPFTSSITGLDNRTIVIPNTVAWGQSLTNFTRQPKRRLDLYIDVSYDDDVDFVTRVLEDVFTDNPRIISSDGLWFGVHNFRDSSVQIRARGWCWTTSYVTTRSEILRAIKYAFDQNGITIPYMQQVEMGPQELADWQNKKSEEVNAAKARYLKEREQNKDE